MTTAEVTGAGRRLLRARETEQLGRIADRIRLGRRVLAFLACESELRDAGLAWLSKATGRELSGPEESSALDLLARLEAAASASPGELFSLSWAPGDRGAVAALNLHREKLRRGASILVWCSPGDVGLLQTEGQDAYSFRDTLVFLSGFPLPEVHVPSDDTPEIRLGRARLDLPGTPFEKALAAADLGTLLLDRGYYEEAAVVCGEAVEPFLEGEPEEAGLGTLAYLSGTFAAALAAVGAVSGARRWAEAAFSHQLQTGEGGEELAAFAGAIEPTLPTPLAAARVLHGAPEYLAWEPFARQYSVHSAEETARSGQLRTWRPKDETSAAGAAGPEARGIIAAALGELDEAEDLWRSSAAAAAERDEDNRSHLLRVVDNLLVEGETACAAALLKMLGQARPTDWLPVDARLRRASLLTLLRRVEPARALLRFEEPPSSLQDGVVYQRCATLAGITAAAADARQVVAAEVARTASYLGTAAGWLPPLSDDTPPFYRILFPGLQANLLSFLPERRAEALELARGAWELATATYPRYAPDHAAKTVRCLLLLGRYDDALDALARAEPEAEALEDLRALAALRGLRVVAHVRRGDTGLPVDLAKGTLRETLEATGSSRLTAESLLRLARRLPPTASQLDVLALLEESSERFAEMPIVALEELCRETKGDVLLARGQRGQAAECFGAAAKRLRHHLLLLRVPLLRAKHRQALTGTPGDVLPAN